MSQFVQGPTRTKRAAAATAQYLLLYLNSSGEWAKNGASNVPLAVSEVEVFTAGDALAGRLRTAEGTFLATAVDAITKGNPVYAAAGGKVSASGSILVGTALETSATDGDIIECCWALNSSVAASVGGTTAAAFLVDSDATTPKIELAAQTGGTGDYKATIKPPATLTAARVFTLGPDADGSLFSDAVFAATPNSSAGAGNSIPVGYRNVAVGAVTNDANDFIVLPAIASCPIGHTIRIACNAGGNFELRTPASSNTKINDVDSDGTQEYLCTDTDLIIVTKATTTGWVAQSLTKLGAVRTAVVPD